MSHFTDWIDWYEFREFTTTHCNILLPKKQRKFLETIVEVAGKKKKSFDRGERLYRARKGCEERKIAGDVLMPAKAFSGKDINIPPPKKRCAGRVNSKGIPCLYLGTDKNTVIAECKPYKEEPISVVCFEMKEKLDLVDFSSEDYRGFFLPLDMSNLFSYRKEKVNPDFLEKIIWGQINVDFSRPIHPEESKREYIPTQIITKVLKKNGFKGVIFNSSLTSTDGDNVALFDSKAVEEVPNSAEVLQVDKIEIRTVPFENNVERRIRIAIEGMRGKPEKKDSIII